MYSGLSTSDESDRNILLDPLGWLNDHTIAAAQSLLKQLVPIYLTGTSENSPTKRGHYHLSKKYSFRETTFTSEYCPIGDNIH